jgi:serine phosphatase RsbU (regulator of sigma subunit)
MRCMEIRGGSHAVEESVSMPGLDAWVYSRPFEGADRGGDVHYVSLCGGGVVTRLAVADVSGHGDSAAGFSASLRDLMRRHINAKSQTRLVAALNREFSALAQLRRFATAVVATYLATKRRLTVCNAGHPRPLWYRAKDGVWSALDEAEARASGAAAEPDNLPLGLDDATRYRQFAVSLGRGDLVVFYTDALIEAADPSGRLLGESGLLDLARGLGPAPGLDAAPALLEAVARHRAGRPADDDVTLVALAHNGSGPRRPSLGEKLDVYAKVFGLKSY